MLATLNMLSYDKYYPQYKWLVYRILNKYANHYNFEDMEQAAKLGFLQALKTFDKNKASLCTWIFMKVRSQCQLLKNQEYVTTCSQNTRKLLEPEERLPFENCDLEYETTNTGMEIINSFFEAHPKIKHKRLFVDRFINEKTKDELEVKYRMNRDRLNEVLNNMIEQFKTWYKEEEL